jgi:1-deoxy-D-xylulose-5-phosphate reductoisomerase
MVDHATSSSSKGITILGATGSIGLSTLDVIARHSDKYHIVALTANTQTELLFKQCVEYCPKYAVMVDIASAEKLEQQLKSVGSDTQVLAGPEALEEVAALSEVDYVMAAIVGAAGLLPSLAAANAGKRVMLANKEALVMSGKLFMDAVKNNGAEL